MPKVRWGGDEVATAQDINDADVGFQPYAGDIPASGVYRFKIRRITHEKFGTGNQGLKVLLILDGSWKPAHAKYDGCPLWTNVVNTKSASAFIKVFCEAIGCTPAEFLNQVVVDDDRLVQTIGKTKIDGQDIVVYANAKRARYTEDSPWRLEGVGTTFLPPVEEDDSEEDDSEAEAEEKPSSKKDKKAKKVKGQKGSKAAAAEDTDPPF